MGKARLDIRYYEISRTEDEWTSEERERVPKTGIDSTKPQGHVNSEYNPKPEKSGM